MIRMSKKVIGIISGSSAALIGGTTVTANILLKDEAGQSPTVNPCGRDSSYHYYSLISQLNDKVDIDQLISINKDGDNITYVIDEKKFTDNLKTILRKALSETTTFKKNYMNFILDCNYRINNTKSISVDLVWSEPNAKIKYFDQFEIILQSA